MIVDDETRPNDPKQCTNFAPAGFYRHWREWHRGHGCNLDDGQPPPGDDYFERWGRHR